MDFLVLSHCIFAENKLYKTCLTFSMDTPFIYFLYKSLKNVLNRDLSLAILFLVFINDISNSEARRNKGKIKLFLGERKNPSKSFMLQKVLCYNSENFKTFGV